MLDFDKTVVCTENVVQNFHFRGVENVKWINFAVHISYNIDYYLRFFCFKSVLHCKRALPQGWL